MMQLDPRASAAAQLSRALLRAARAAADRESPLAAPYAVPKTPLAGQLNAGRSLAVQQLDLAGVKRVAKATECTVNDVVLYLSGTALRRFLDVQGRLPDRPLTAAVPVNVRGSDDQRLGNVVSQMYTSLATDVADPRARLEAVKRSAAAGKAHLQSLPPGMRMPYTLVVTAPYMASLSALLGGHAPVPYNLNISNVPGPAERKYLDGAR